MSDHLVVFLLAVVVTALATPLCILIAPKIGAMDIPKDKRRVHKKPIPRFGGFAIYLGMLTGFFRLGNMSEQMLGIIGAATLIMIIGIVDDIKGVPAKIKLVGQIICAVLLWFSTLRFSGMANFFSFGPDYIVFPVWLSMAVTVFWIVAIINTINLIDGLDGLAAGVVLIACLSIAYIADYTDRPDTCIIILAVAGACAGFLFYNFNPARIFMGDSGSMLLGLLLASVSLVGDTPTKSVTLFSATVPVMLLILPIFDTSFAIVRRTVKHRPIFEADKGHLHHRIMAMGFGQRRTVLVLYSISGIMAVAGILWTMRMKGQALVLALIAGVLIFIFLGIGIDENDKIAELEAQMMVKGSSEDPEVIEEKIGSRGPFEL
ncbi:MAG: undecaprenyl/decaprenyl-phosphate alpha-N-acetylglucosaminyl 1-phosphate transferase [Firmicutes bacterium]|nr:undecaprenyl/decaprenyl-phosphate alpha-N-acetylglucosaminyl 1-phosphate transferase [Bacillota bacterium]MBQ1888032.1 undecaprenyl/decaprenyl-phosphate alpha-N-acetylglucosaminyl 1-phosphate transferase [Bacillota bacterium]MBQ3578563.1 undecaprenyl/decaprenyl-phosphate alpha-N-acetylglucosaminyl 1-phosphate transferase [Bacillota bacterium]MBQ5436640.1 undecaprenyl/decaprenyl-phosphate alpha-N-acetylglucosaminyl 1-phosphate transferase [Bacillota bacterium]MBQ6259648.1 undecaprenyl/decapre